MKASSVISVVVNVTEFEASKLQAVEKELTIGKWPLIELNIIPLVRYFQNYLPK